MTNNTTINVSRELLERLRSYIPNGDGYNSQYANDLADAAEAIERLSAPSPAGVDGLEVIGWYTDDHLDDKSATTYSREVAVRWLAKGWPVTGIANESDAHAIIDGLRGENERIRLNIAEYNEAISCYQSERDQQARWIGELASHLEFAVTILTVAGLAGNAQVEAMRSALSAGKDSDQ